MKLYHSYILRKVVLALVVSAVVCSLALAVLSIVRLGKDRTLGIPPLLVLKLLAHYNVFLSIYSVPISLLIACLLVFGRLSADNELVALRASGVAPVRTFSAPLGLALVLSAAMLWLNGWVAPHSHEALAELRFDAFSLEAFFTPGRTIHLKNYSIHVGARNEGMLERVTIVQASPGGRTTTIEAEWGELTDRRSEGKVQLDLCEVELFVKDKPSPSGEAGSGAERAPAADDASGESGPEDDAGTGDASQESTQLVRERAKLYQIIFDFEDIKSRAGRLADKDDLTVRELLARRTVVRREGDMALAGAYAFEFNKRLVFSLTPLVFALIGVPLGVRVHRGERSLGSALAVLVALAYFLAIIGIEQGITAGGLVPSVLVWVPCVALCVLGVLLMARVNRGR
jgi:lipopolysaccharide export LptBFGC system permease protein LptF